MSAPPPPRGLLVAVVGLLVVTSGCSALVGDPLTFTADPASACEDALIDTGYEPDVSRWQNTTRSVEVGGVSREVRVNSHVRTYTHPGPNGSTPAAGFGVLATPRAAVAGQSLNPAADWSTERQVRELGGRLRSYGDVSGLSRTGTYQLTVLGTDTDVAVFAATGTDADGSRTDIVIHVTRVRHGGDIVVAGGVHEAETAGERDRFVTLFGCVDHAGAAATSTAPGTGVTATPTAVAVDLRDADLPPGVTRSGVANATELLAAHRAAGLARPYRERVDPTSTDPDRRIRLIEGTDRLAVRHVTESGTVAYWATTEDGGQVFVRTADSVTAAAPGTPATADLGRLSGRARTALAPFVRFGAIETVGAVERDGRRLVRLRVTGLDADALAASPVDVGGPDTTVQDTSGTLLVTPEGAIRRAQLEVTLRTDDGRQVTDRFRYRLDRVPADALARPEWTDRTQRATATHANASVIAVRTDGAAVPAGTTLTLVGDGDRLATVTVPERVAPDEVVYVAGNWITVGSDLEPSVSVGTPPARPDTPVDFRAYSSLVVVGETPDGGFQTRVNEAT